VTIKALIFDGLRMGTETTLLDSWERRRHAPELGAVLARLP
jgi:hypothetical protein